MKTPLLLACSAVLAGTLPAQDLTQADRETLLESIEKLRENVDSLADSKFSAAINAYRQAMVSDTATFEFYLQCVEKVEYTDQKRSGRDFRNWKKQEEHRLDDPGFRRALRHQLRWLVLSLEAASPSSDPAATRAKAKGIVADVFEDLEKIANQEGVLSQPATATVFAKAYDIDGKKVDDWPSSPLALEEIYEKLVFPPLRQESRLDELRNAWMARIAQELEIRDKMARYARHLLLQQQRMEEAYQTRNGPREDNYNVHEAKIGTAKAMRPPEYKQFLAEEVPELLWEMEVDLFKSGDQAGAAKRMLDHLKKYVDHKSAAKWTEEFTGLLMTGAEPGKPASVAGTENDGSAGGEPVN